MTLEEIIKLLRTEKECLSRADKCGRMCDTCALLRDTDKLLEMYSEAIYRFEMMGEFEKEYRIIVSENQELTARVQLLTRKLKKKRKEKKRWKRKALIYKSGLDNLRKMLKGDSYGNRK